MSEKKKRRPHIHVHEVQNGYVLMVNGREFMTFSPEGLLREIFLRVGCKEMDWCDRSFVANIVEAAGTWPTVGEALTAVAHQKEVTENVRQELRCARQEVSRLNDEYDQLAARQVKAERDKEELKASRELYDKVFKMYQSECVKALKLDKENGDLRLKIREMEAHEKRLSDTKETRKRRSREQVAKKNNFSDRKSKSKRTKP